MSVSSSPGLPADLPSHMANILLQTFQRLLYLHLLPQCCPVHFPKAGNTSKSFIARHSRASLTWSGSGGTKHMPDTYLMSHQTWVSATWRQESTDSIPSSLAQPLGPTSPKSSRFKAQGRYLLHKTYTSTATALHPCHALSSSRQPCDSLIVGTTYSTAEDWLDPIPIHCVLYTPQRAEKQSWGKTNMGFIHLLPVWGWGGESSIKKKLN